MAIENKKIADSKKAKMSIGGAVLCMVAGYGATLLGPIGIQALPYVIGGIVGCLGIGVGAQGLQDAAAAFKGKPDSVVAPEKPGDGPK